MPLQRMSRHTFRLSWGNLCNEKGVLLKWLNHTTFEKTRTEMWLQWRGKKTDTHMISIFCPVLARECGESREPCVRGLDTALKVWVREIKIEQNQTLLRGWIYALGLNSELPVFGWFINSFYICVQRKRTGAPSVSKWSPDSEAQPLLIYLNFLDRANHLDATGAGTSRQHGTVVSSSG